MTKKEFSAAVAIAQSREIDLFEKHTDNALDGFGLRDFKPVVVTLFAAASCIRWQCSCFDGSWDADNMRECWESFKHKVSIVGIGDHDLMDPAVAEEVLLQGALLSGVLQD